VSDTLTDPYAGIDSEEERQAVYQRLQAQYAVDLAIWEREQKEAERRKSIYDEGMKAWYYQRDIQKDLDTRAHKSILTIAAGSFGVSFAFISQVVPLDKASGMVILVAAWALFGLSIMLSIFELKIGSVIQDIFLNNAEKNIERGYAGERLKGVSSITMWPERVISWLAFSTFGAGVVCLIYFVLMNITFQ